LPTKTRVYGSSTGLAAVAVAAGCLFGALWAAPPGQAQSELDCDRPTQAREMIARLRLAEIEGAEDIHRAAMWEAFGRCPEGGAGGPCRTDAQQRFETEWARKRAQIDAKYRAVLGDFERRCRAIISRARPEAGQSGFLINRASSPTTPRRKASTQITKMLPCTTVTQAPSWAR
jgi:hypothetical protein